jgi:hypothetical protein
LFVIFCHRDEEYAMTLTALHNLLLERISMGMLREASGFALLAAGVIGVVIPIIPGIPLLLAGGLILAPKYPAIRKSVQRVRGMLAKRRGNGQAERHPS